MKSIIRNTLTLLTIACLCFTGGCKEEVLGPLHYGQKPSPVKEYKIESMAGGAKITFKMPPSEDLMYVKAVYKIASGLQRETKSSLYKNYLIVDGFEKEGEYEVTLYAVAKGEIESDPTPVKINTFTPPYLATFSNITLQETFGGVNITYKNENEADLVYQLLEKDKDNKWVEKYTHYSNFKEGDFSVRGYDTLNLDFGVFVKDRWGNISDTLFRTCKPLFETLIDKKKFKDLALPGDMNIPHSNYPQWVLSRIWDDKTTGGECFFHTSNNIAMPSHFSIDLGQKVKLSRFKYWQRPSDVFKNQNVRKFELWGSNNPSSDGSWEGWTKIKDYESVKPSGRPDGEVTTEDIEFGAKGEDFDAPMGAPAYRYIRWNSIETWSKIKCISIAELTFWGKVEE